MTKLGTSMVVGKRGDERVSEPFNTHKLYASIEAACLSVGIASGLAADTARHTTETVSLWLHDKPEVTSDDIRRIATQSLTITSPEAAYLYKHHHTIL